MTERVLVLNAGSSSLKYQLVNPVGGEAIASGLVERIGEPDGVARHTFAGNTTRRTGPITDHGEALRTALARFEEAGPDLARAQVVAVGQVVDGLDLAAVRAQRLQHLIHDPRRVDGGDDLAGRGDEAGQLAVGGRHREGVAGRAGGGAGLLP